AAGIETTVIDHTAFDGREAFENALHDAISASGAEFVCLAGFMRMLTGGFVGKWRDRMINIHPSLLPDYKGLHVHERVVEAGEKFSGCTVHFVVPDLDSGPIIVQAKVPVEPGDDADTLAARVLDEEHKILPEAVRLIAEDRVSVDGDRVIIT
ncbi:MAG: phosphoribosylglycinamide formyltransferase, partial [Rhodospirillaceae bacterium]|nr:phosphoribosylglycinamide formyltransferase [Rhodospirillaceae bacterium]